MNRLSEQVDILLEVAQQLSDSQAFGSIAALALVDQEYQDIVQPFLRHLKRKVVLDLAELQWFPKEGYPDIQIIECTYVTGLPINPHIRNHGFATHLHDAGLRPWLITFYGRPHPFIATFRTAYFPHVSVVRVVERLGMVELQRIGAPYSTFGNTMVAHHLARGLWEIDAAPAPRREDADAGVGRCELRYRCHQDHELGFRADRPGQIWSRLEVVTRDGNRMRTTVWRVSEETTASGFIKDVMQEHPREHFCIPSGTRYRSVTFHIHVELLPGMQVIPDDSFSALRGMGGARAHAFLDMADKGARLDVRVFVFGGQSGRRLGDAKDPDFIVSLAPCGDGQVGRVPSECGGDASQL